MSVVVGVGVRRRHDRGVRGGYAGKDSASAVSRPPDPDAEPPDGARAHAPGPDPDSDAVVDELAGDFTDAPDLLLVRLT